MTSTIPLLAGALSTMTFAASVLPMVVKAWRTRDLRSYSRGHLVLANVGNGVHSVYVFHLPPGPIWVLHTFYVVTSALMLVWNIRYAVPRRRRNGAEYVTAAPGTTGGPYAGRAAVTSRMGPT
jgi:hypothetical protein